MCKNIIILYVIYLFNSYILFINLGFFISPTQLNLIVTKLNCIEIYLINECGLLLLSEMELNEKIQIMKVFRPRV